MVFHALRIQDKATGSSLSRMQLDGFTPSHFATSTKLEQEEKKKRTQFEYEAFENEISDHINFRNWLSHCKFIIPHNSREGYFPTYRSYTRGRKQYTENKQRSYMQK
ncbi:unnamed protein product [Cuscuta epithymum]|uniref:Ycf1 n=1 Tax=Cuscuta epithymum TaxID=186058 RepID=A0AAV0CMW6_9ASTE|nr:unnamed protein product [Cuscuta epithymum]